MPPTSSRASSGTYVSVTHLRRFRPSWFVRKWSLQECVTCQLFFRDLSKHSQCRGRGHGAGPRRTAREATSETTHSVGSEGAEDHSSATGGNLAEEDDDHQDGRRATDRQASTVADRSRLNTWACTRANSYGSHTSDSIDDTSSPEPDPPPPSFSEQGAWALVENLSWEEILRTCPSTVLNIKEYLQPLWCQAVRIPLRSLASNISDQGAWKLLFLLPTMLLSRAKRGGKKGSGDIKRKFRRFLGFNWEPLLRTVGQQAEQCKEPMETTRQATLRRVELSVRQGELSRAARILTSPGVAPDTIDTLDSLKRKHPEPHQPLAPLPPVEDGAISLDREVILKALHSAPRGSAPGPSGLRFEHLKPCLGARDLTDFLCKIVQRVAAGNPSRVIGQALASARLIALRKVNGDVRPIAVGEALRRLVARSICIQEKCAMAELLSPVQYGVAIPGGLEQLVHQVQAGLEAHEDWGLFKCDLTNAFNSISRAAFFDQVRKELPSIMPITELLYGQPSPLVYKGKSSVTILTSQEGVHQGDPLGPFYFCIAINHILKKLQADNRDVNLLAFFDDINILGPPQRVGELVPLLVKELETCGLKMNPRKSELFCVEADGQEWASGMRRLSEGTVLLGAAVGSQDYINDHYKEIVRDGQDLLKGIKELQSSQCAFLLLSRCANTRVANITRLSPPAVTTEALSLHDDQIEQALAAILETDHLPELANTQARLRVANGGLGLPSMSNQRHHAFLSSWADCLRALLSSESPLDNELRLTMEQHSQTPTAIGLRDCHQALSSRLGESVPPLAALHLQPPKLQSRLGKELDDSHAASLLQLADQQGRARLLSTSCREAGAWIQAIPRTQHLSLTQEEFRLGVSMRLGMTIQASHIPHTCPNPKCSSTVDPKGHHLLTCGKGPGRVRLHDRMVRAWHSLILSKGLRASVEPRDLYSDQRRPDIVVPDFRDGRGIHLDFSLTHPCLPSNVSTSAGTPGAAAAKREQTKRTTYEDCPERFEPIVVEHPGRWGKAAIKLLNELARQASSTIPDVSHSQFTDYWYKRLGCELLKDTAFTVEQNAQGWHRKNHYIDELRAGIFT